MSGFLILTGFSNSHNMTPYIYTGLTKDGKWNFTHKIRITEPIQIINAVCSALDIDEAKLLSSSRKKELSEARCIAIALILKANRGLSLKRVGAIFSRDHSTVIYNRDLYEDLTRFNKQFTAKANKVKELI